MPATSQVNVPTVGEIARRLGVPLHRIEYVVRARRIAPSGRAGNARVFTEADVARIASELRRIESAKEAGYAC
jgi:DNA-binding transcriptional MerR regulator